MASLFFYIGQTVFVSFIKGNKRNSGTAIILAKDIEKGDIKYELLGMDGKFYKEISSECLHYVFDIEGENRSIVQGPAVSATARCCGLKEKTVKDNKEKWTEYLKAVYKDITDNKLLVETVNKLKEKEFIESTENADTEAATFERIPKYSQTNIGFQGGGRWGNVCDC
jgi:hypothetical protein